MVNDFVTDCGPNAEDANILHIIHKGITNCKCDLKYQIPCRKGHNKCYNVSEICTFKINEVDLLSPCRTGEHLQNCTHFECNMMFKCPHYYCYMCVMANGIVPDDLMR